MTESRRRDFLSGVGLAGVVGMPSLTGCLDLSLGGFLGADSLSWVPAPETLSAIERFDVTTMTPRALEAAEPLSGNARAKLRSNVTRTMDLLSLSFADLSGLYRIGPFAAVLEGTFQPDRIDETLTDAGFQSAGNDEVYALYSAPSRHTSLAVSPAAVVVGPADGDAAVVQAVVEAARGERNRYRSSESTVEELSEVLGTGDLVIASMGSKGLPIDDARAGGLSWRFDQQTATVTLAFVYPVDGTVPTDALERVARDDSLHAFEEIDVGKRGRSGIITATVPSVSADALTPFDAMAKALFGIPSATFDVTYGATRRTTTIIHAGGQAAPRNQLFLRGSGFRTDPALDQDEPGRWAGESTGSLEAVAPGDEVTVAIERDASIQLRYRPLGAGTARTLATVEPP